MSNLKSHIDSLSIDSSFHNSAMKNNKKLALSLFSNTKDQFIIPTIKVYPSENSPSPYKAINPGKKRGISLTRQKQESFPIASSSQKKMVRWCGAFDGQNKIQLVRPQSKQQSELNNFVNFEPLVELESRVVRNKTFQYDGLSKTLENHIQTLKKEEESRVFSIKDKYEYPSLIHQREQLKRSLINHPNVEQKIPFQIGNNLKQFIDNSNGNLTHEPYYVPKKELVQQNDIFYNPKRSIIDRRSNSTTKKSFYNDRMSGTFSNIVGTDNPRMFVNSNLSSSIMRNSYKNNGSANYLHNEKGHAYTEGSPPHERRSMKRSELSQTKNKGRKSQVTKH